MVDFDLHYCLPYLACGPLYITPFRTQECVHSVRHFIFYLMFNACIAYTCYHHAYYYSRIGYL